MSKVARTIEVGVRRLIQAAFFVGAGAKWPEGARQALGHRDAAAEVTFSLWRLSRCALWHEVGGGGGGGGGGGEWQEAGYDDKTVCTSWMTDEFTSYEVPYCATLSYFRQAVQ